MELAQTVVYQTREEYVAVQIRNLISDGQLKPGQELDQSKLAQQLGVSRSPVRDAVRRLAAEGLIELVSHRQATVAHLSLEDLEEIYRILACLEGLAASLAVPQLTEEDVKELEDLYSQMSSEMPAEEWDILHDQFHNSLYKRAGTRRLSHLIENLRTLRRLASPYVRRYVSSPEYRRKLMGRHRRILDACAAGDPQQAEQESRAHVSETWEELKAIHPE